RLLPALPAHRAVVAGGVFTVIKAGKTLPQAVEQSLCPVSAVGKDEGALMILDLAVQQPAEPVRNLFLAGGDEVGNRTDQTQIQMAAEATVHHLHRAKAPGQEVRHL